MVLGLWIRWKFKVLNMEHRNSVRITLHDLRRIYAGDHGPAAIEFKSDLLSIGESQQFRVRRLTVSLDKLARMVVIPKADSRSRHLFSESIELFRVVAPIIE